MILLDERQEKYVACKSAATTVFLAHPVSMLSSSEDHSLSQDGYSLEGIGKPGKAAHADITVFVTQHGGSMLPPGTLSFFSALIAKQSSEVYF